MMGRLTVNQLVVGSIPAAGANKINNIDDLLRVGRDQLSRFCLTKWMQTDQKKPFRIRYVAAKPDPTTTTAIMVKLSIANHPEAS